MKYQRKKTVVEAVTFDELVEHGKANGGNVVDGMPWSFTYAGLPVTHENNDLYLVNGVRFRRGDLLVTSGPGVVTTWSPEAFAQFYELAGDTSARIEDHYDAGLAGENAILREYFLATEDYLRTAGHEDATAEDERKAEERQEAARRAARQAVLYADGKLMGAPEMFQREAHELACRANVWGVILTVEQRSVPPLAQGRLETVVSARAARSGNHTVAAR